VPTVLQDRARAEGTVRVIVELALPSGRVAETALPDQARAAFRREILTIGTRVLNRLAQQPHRVLRRFVTTPLIVLEVGPPALQELDASGFMVKRVREDRIHKPVLFDSVPLIGADQAWAQGYDGTGTVVAIIDSGVDSTHPFLAGKVVEEACYSTTSGTQSTTLCPNGAQEQIGPGAGINCPLEAQGCWHGTHVAGIAAGNGDPADLPIWGVGRGANIMAVQVFSQINRFIDCGGTPPCLGAFTSDILSALERVYVLRTTYNFAAVNMSLGGGLFSAACDDEPYKPFIDNLRSVGIATVVASGNDGSTDQLSAPACVSTAVSVGATTKEDQVADFSNVAPNLSLFAPGADIISSYPGGEFAVASGTSMAAPHVTGAWAILKQARPDASVDDVLRALTETGVMITDARAGTGTTKPRIQVDLALSDIQNPGAPIIRAIAPDKGTVATSPTVTLDGLNFAEGATVSFGAGVTVTSTTLVSARQLVVAIAIAGSAPIGPRDVTVTNLDGKVGTRAGGFTVMPPPPTMSLAFLGKLRDKVGQGSSAFGPDGQLDGTFRVIVNGGIWPRTVTNVQLQRTGSIDIWDTNSATPYWALGASSGLDGALLNAANGIVSFAVADGGAFHVFASDLNPTPFATGNGFTVTASFADGTTASATVTLPAIPTITSVSPSVGAQGASLTVTVVGTNFQPGATVSFGAGITIGTTTVSSATQISIALAIAPTATAGPRDVSIANPVGQSVIRVGGFTVQPPAATLGLAFLGRLRDKVGRSSSAFTADGTLDGSFSVTLVSGSGSRTVTNLELRRTGSIDLWDTNSSTAPWALGASSSLDSALLNAANGTVSFAVADGGAFYVFASDNNPTPFVGGATFMVTASFADGTSASANVTLPAAPAISTVSPNTGAPGTSLTVTIAGTSFQSGAAVSFGTGITVGSTTVSSGTQISAAIAIAAGAAGPRDVSVTNPDSQSAVRPGGFTVQPPPPTLVLSFLGRLRDKVGQGNTAFGPDGALDGTFQVTLQPGSGSRTITRLELRRTGSIDMWDTDPATGAWALAATNSLDGALLNAANGTVSFGVADGGTFYVFASDYNPTPFTGVANFSVTAYLADGGTASTSVALPALPSISSVTPSTGTPGATLNVTITGTSFQPGANVSLGAGITVSSTTVSSATQISAAVAIASGATLGPRDVTVANPSGQSAVRPAGFTVQPPPPTLNLSFLGRLRDKVGQNNTAFAPDGALDGTFQVTVQAGSGPRTITRLELRRTGSVDMWDTNPVTGAWALGASSSLDGALLNVAGGTVNFAVADGGAFYVFASDYNPTPFIGGASFVVTAFMADGTTASASATLPPLPSISGVSPSSGVLGTSPAVTITGTGFQPGATVAFGAGVTVSSTTIVSATQISASLTIASGATVGPRDVTVTNPDGQSAVRPGGFAVQPPPPTLGLSFVGKARDKVGPSSSAFSGDGQLDGTFQVTVQAGSGARTVTNLVLRRVGSIDTWDSSSATAPWALGAANSLDGTLLNTANGTVNFGVADGSAFYVFASDNNPSPFVSGQSFSLTASFADGSTVTVTTTIP
jgi:subtilisin family serine protease